MTELLHFWNEPKNVPTEKVPDGPLAGNGDIGVALGCPQPGVLDFYLGKNDIWNSDSRWETPGIRSYGKLTLRCPQGAGAFYAQQRLTDGTIRAGLSAEWGSINVETRVLRHTNLVVQRILCRRGKCQVSVDFTHTTRAEAVQTAVERRGGAIAARKSYEGAPYLWPMEAHSLTRVLDRDALTFFLNPGESATVLTALVTSWDSNAPEEACRHWLARDLAPLEQAHKAWWDGFWRESSVSLSTEPEVEQFYTASQYLMACCCEPGKFPPGLFGPWATTDYPAWCGDYHLNYNYEAPFWGLYSSNHISLTDCYDQPLLDYMPASERAAREKLGCGSLYTLVGIGPKGLRTAALETPEGNDDVNYWGQKSNAAYAAVNMFLRWRATRDGAYAMRVYPYLKACADFWLDYLTLENGRYMDRDDCVLENSKMAVGVFDWASEPWCEDQSGHVNPIVTMGLLRMLFRGLLDMYPEDALCEKWRHVLDHLPDFPTMERNGRTVFRLTEEGLDWNKSNSLETQHIYPAGCVGLGSGPGLLETGRETHRQMGRWDDYNAFPTYFPAAARLGLPAEEILSHLREQLRGHGYANGFLFYGGGGIECCSGVPATVNEMLLQSHEGVLRLFPVWRDDASFRSLRADGAFLVSAALRDGRVEDIRITSEKGRPCTVARPNGKPVKVLCEGQALPAEVVNNCARFQTEPGKTYSIIVME